MCCVLKLLLYDMQMKLMVMPVKSFFSSGKIRIAFHTHTQTEYYIDVKIQF